MQDLIKGIGSERLSHSLRITQLGSGGPGVLAQVAGVRPKLLLLLLVPLQYWEELESQAQHRG